MYIFCCNSLGKDSGCVHMSNLNDCVTGTEALAKSFLVTFPVELSLLAQHLYNQLANNKLPVGEKTSEREESHV